MKVTFVLGGGGALGAFQAGSLLELISAGLVPDALAGCSVGALNAAFLAGEPTQDRARELIRFWRDDATHSVLAPSRLARLRGVPALLRNGDALLDRRPLQALLARCLDAHDLSELAIPLSVTTTCLDCAQAIHHRNGPLAEVLMASCALPGLLSPVRLPDGHAHVDGGVLCGVPVAAATELAPETEDELILVADVGLDPVTGRAGSCAASPEPTSACGLPITVPSAYVAPLESAPAPVLDVVLRSFTVARAAANRAAVADAVRDPRVRVLPHVADAWAAGLLPSLPRGPRDLARTADLVDAGRAATAAWLLSGGLDGARGHVMEPREAAEER